MARKVEVTLIDDIDGSKAARTVEFALEGAQYQIDLSEENIAALEKALAPYVEKAHRVPAAAGRGRRRAAASTDAGASAAQVRAWAAEQGIKVSPRGRIPAEVMDAFVQAH